MQLSAGTWHKLTLGNIAAAPAAPGVIEIGNLVRTVLLIERGGGCLRERLAEIGPVPAMLPATVGGYYFRFELARAEDEAFERRLAHYRAEHRGNPPIGNLRGGDAARPARLRAA